MLVNGDRKEVSCVYNPIEHVGLPMTWLIVISSGLPVPWFDFSLIASADYDKEITDSNCTSVLERNKLHV